MKKTGRRLNREQLKEIKRLQAKSYREYRKSLTPEQKEEEKQRRIWKKQERENAKLEKEAIRKNKLMNKKSLAILKLMEKQDLFYHHHGVKDSKMESIKHYIQKLKNDKELYQEYNSYIWNYQGEGNNYMPICQFGCIFSSSEFDTIFDVPTDGTYKFHIADSGQRGLGSFDYIYATKSEDKVHIKKVNPGAIRELIN